MSDDAFLFSASLRDNVAYARPDATDAEIEDSARRAGLAEVVAELPDGYDTRIGERGLTLSGGQRQRVAIARALLAQPRILILDDATSSVDATTESRIKDALREVMEGRTTFVIAHRLSTIALADEIVVLDGGTIAARGSHDELRESSPVRRDRRARAARPGVPHARERGAGGGGPMSRLRSLWGVVRGERGRTDKLRKLLALLRPYRVRVILMFVALFLATAASLAPPYLAGRAIDDGIRAGDAGALTWITVAFVAAAAIYFAGTYAQTYLTGWVGQRALADLRRRIFAHLQTLSIGFYSRNRSGVLISRLTNDVQALDSLVTDGVVTLFASTLTLGGTAVILYLLDPGLALITFLVFPVLFAGSIAFRIASADAYRQTREKIALITAYLQETLSGVRIVRAFGQEPRHERELSALNDENREANMKTVYLNAAYFPSVELLSAIATAAILLYGGDQVLEGAVRSACWRRSSSTCRASSTRSSSCPSSTRPTRPGWRRSTRSSTCSTRSPTCATPSTRSTCRGCGVRCASRGCRSLREAGRRLGHRQGGRAGARRRHARDPAGQTVALVGATGAGKSTLAKLVARFYDPDSGRVLVDGHDLRDVRERSLRSQLGIVPQESFLFSGTIRDNIAFGADERGAGGHRRGGGPRRRRARVRRAAAGRLRDRGRRARRPAVGRPAPARRVRPRGGRRPAHPDPRRGDLERRRPHRGRHRARPPAPARRPHRARHRSPPLHDPRRRSHRRPRPWPDRRAGHPRRAARRRRPLRAAVSRLG